ncbi:MAG: MDR family MFS transporter [Azospirillaceae bacterium]|nr:MDR family MFS transporter [Azospirillaceae bacterium]
MSPSQPEAAVLRPSTRALWIALPGLMMTLMLAALDQNIVATALPRIVGDLGGLSHLSWVVTAFLVTSTTTTPLYGKLSDIYGRRPAFVVSILVFLVGSALCGQAQSMVELILFRAVQGIGAGGLFTLTQTAVGDLVEPRQRGRYQGMFVAIFAVCSIAGPLLGGLITDALSWRWIFYINIPVGLLALILICTGLRHRRPSRTHDIDYAGAFLMIVGTGALLLMLSWGGVEYPWFSPEIIGAAALAVAAFSAMIVVERRVAEPILPLHLFNSRIFVIATLVLGLTSMAMFSMLVFMPMFFQLLLGASPSRAGLMIAPTMVGFILSSVIGGRLVSKTGRTRNFVVTGLGLATLSTILMARTAETASTGTLIEGLLVTLGLGLGLTMPVLTIAVQNIVPRADLGVATAATAYFRSLGSAVGVALSGTILTARLTRDLPAMSADQGQGPSLLDAGIDRILSLPMALHESVIAAYRDGLSVAFTTSAVIALAAFLIVLLLPDQPLRSDTAQPEPASGSASLEPSGRQR